MVLQVWTRNVNEVTQNFTVIPRYILQRKTYAEFWDEMDSAIGNDTLYPETFDVDGVLERMRNAKIIHADMMYVTSSLKWILILEGGQGVIFKPQTVPKSRRFEHCFKFHCEHAEYEVAAFVLNRLLGLRNMPYTTGRVVSWWDDIVPVATQGLIQRFKNESQDNRTVCARIQCNTENEHLSFCFEDGVVPGAMLYFLHQDVNIFKDGGHPFYKYKISILKSSRHRDLSKELDRSPGDDTYCNVFRAVDLYRQDRYFADVTDISVLDYLLSHSDSTHTYINTSSGEIMNVMIDFGRAFCQYPEHLRILAPVIQCCKIRKRVYENLVKYRHNLLDMFEELSKNDPLYPILQPDLLEIMKRRQAQLLSLIDYCIASKNLTAVLIDV